MSKGSIAKVMKYELRYLDGCGDFHEMQKRLWELQRKTREIMNRSIQIAFHWDYTGRKRFKETGEYPDVHAETGFKRLDGYIYDQLKEDYSEMASSNLNATIQKAWKKYTSSKKEVLRGSMSLPSYKKDQPLLIYQKSVKLSRDAEDTIAECTLFAQKFKKEQGFASNVRFKLSVNDKTQSTILSRIFQGEYSLGQCQLVYDRPKWFLYLTYTFAPARHALEAEKILGVDLGETLAICASIINEQGCLKIEGGEVTAFAKKIEARKRSMQKQAAVCGDGRKGHGTKTRVSAVYQVTDKISNFRDTINHRYSKTLIDYAVKNQCGVIQMEDLSGIKEQTDFPKFLRHWTYYDLQAKIEAKAQEQGIRVVKVNPRYTSKRCSRCGCINPDNRQTQALFCCVSCGFKANADYNASQNLSIKGIDKLIQATAGANMEQT